MQIRCLTAFVDSATEFITQPIRTIQNTLVLIFAGTTEGRKLSEHLAHAGIMHTVCVATEYGQIVLKEHSCMKIHQGRMDIEEISEFVKQGDFAAIVDATHPYAADP